MTSVGIISAYGLDRNHFDIIIQLKPNANRETDDFNEGKGVSHFTEKLEVCHLKALTVAIQYSALQVLSLFSCKWQM